MTRKKRQATNERNESTARHILRVLGVSEQQWNALRFALTHYAVLALMTLPLSDTRETYLDRVEQLETRVCKAKGQASKELALTIDELAQLLVLLQAHLMALRGVPPPPQVPVPGPEHMRALETFYESALGLLPVPLRSQIAQQVLIMALHAQRGPVKRAR